MFKRILSVNEVMEEMSIFLFGARQTGKSTYLKNAFPNAMYIDLLDASVRRIYKNQPSVLYDQLASSVTATIAGVQLLFRLVVGAITSFPSKSPHLEISRYRFLLIFTKSNNFLSKYLHISEKSTTFALSFRDKHRQ